MELCRLRSDDLPNHFARNTQIAANRLDRHLPREIRQTNFGYRLYNQHLELGLLKDQEACVDPYPRGPDWMPITPKTGSLFHAESHWDLGSGQCLRVLEGHSSSVAHVAALPDGRAVSASWDMTLRLWDLASGRCLRVLEGHSNWVSHVAALERTPINRYHIRRP